MITTSRLNKMIPLPRTFASIFISGIILLQACNESNFSGAAARSGGGGGTIKKCAKPPCDGGPTPPVTLDMEFSGDKKIEAIQNTKIWTATTDGTIKRFTIEGDQVTETIEWSKDKTGASGTFGMRTYVTEGGFIGARSPKLFFIDPNNKNSVAKTKDLQIPASTRICVASYLKNGQRYMIAGWGNGSFHEYAMDDKPPYAPKWDDPPTRTGTLGTGSWGYSCFIDQQQKIFYSQNNTAGNVVGLNLNTYQAVDVSKTSKSATHKSSNPLISPYTYGMVKQSYAMSGDPYGNIYNGAGYTSAYDRASRSVWFSNGASIVVIDEKCLHTEPSCTNFASFSPGVAIGPMSPLKDGRIVGISKGGGDIYLMKLRDKSNLKSGIDVVPVGSAGGYAYMYTDFTGATLYITESEQTFKPVDMPKYVASKPIKMAVFKWIPTVNYAAGSLSVDWRNIKLEARCYSSAASKPAYVEIAKVHPSDKGTELNVPSCTGGKYQFVDVKLTQLNNDSSLVGIDTISVGFKQ